MTSRVARKIKIHHLDPSVDRRIKIAQAQQVFGPYRMMLSDLNAGVEKEASPITMFLKIKGKREKY
jgi:hypothetical protein